MTSQLICLLVVASSLVIVSSDAAPPDHEPKSVCYNDLGCFSTDGVFHDYVLPNTPTEIGTSFHCYTRQHNAIVKAGDQAGFHSCSFDGSKRTIAIVHGYMNDASTAWLTDMKNALLKQGDYNVIITSWGKGAKVIYNKAAANCILVGAQLHHLILYLHSDLHASYSNMHLIGHSLGAQSCGYAASKVHTVGRISGLDPAQPYFEDRDHQVRLDPSDATFVDIIHTDATKFIGIAGYGVVKPCGHVDFYPNGGKDQPGCVQRQIIGAIADFLNGSLHAAAKDISCSHSRAHDLYLHSIGQSSCPLQGHSCSNAKDYEAGKCFACDHGSCPPMGFHAQPSTHHGTYYLGTLDKEPFCGTSYFVEIELAQKMWDGYGEVFVQLIGEHGQTDMLQFNKRSERFQHGQVEHHMVTANKDVGAVREVKIKFVHTTGLGGLFTTKELAFHRASIRSQSMAHPVQFCAHDHTVKDNEVEAVFSGSHC